MNQVAPPPILNYATFWPRFAAMLIDFLILLPLGLINLWAQSVSKAFAIALVLPTAAYFSAYYIFCHGRFGQTVGKRIMNIRVVKLNGESIGWREAWARSSVDLVFAGLWAVAAFVALFTISDADYNGMHWKQRTQALIALHPAWLSWTQTASAIWMWSEVFVILTNARRRALHDFIAGTVVVRVVKNTGSLAG